jgi:WD40 repeat protein/tetratricopeptide (TPR) repeat protein
MSEPLSYRVQNLFNQAIDLPAEQRAAFLSAACAGDDALRAEVESLLACDDNFTEGGGGDGALKSPLVRAPDPETLAASDPRPALWPAGPPVRVGHYRILRRIAEGGMGAVYEAEQENPRRPVALKVIRPGLASPALVKRIAQEPQILGRLQHPGIAQVYEAGLTVDGQPFFAMELIRGVPLDEFAYRQNLGAHARLELLARVCDAVQHAHERGIIHRDLKPGNILVDETGQPKVLDFGVARATDADRKTSLARTLDGQLMGTPAYMSPEQVVANPALDQRTDVYALGVILFELLSGRLPYDLAELPLPEVALVISEQEPLRLGAIDSRCRGDIETIAAKALAKDTGRRYASAGELAADLRRHLAQEPILARPPSALYQLRKFARRHRPLVGAVAGVLLAVLVGAAVAVAYALSEREQRRIADVKTEDEKRAKELAQQKTRDEQSARAEAEQKTREEMAARAETERKTEDEKRARQQAESNRQAARKNLYVANVRLARQAWDGGHVDQMRQLLEEAAAGFPGDEDLRGFEWHYLWRLAQPVEQMLRGQGRFPRAVAFSPDGRRLATAGFGGSIYLWDATTGQEVRRIAGPDQTVSALAYSPDGRQLASAGFSGTSGVVRLWDAATAQQLRTIPVPGLGASGVAFSSDGHRLAVVSRMNPPKAQGRGPFGGQLFLFAAATGDPIGSTPELDEPLEGVSFSPDGTRLASAGPKDRKAHVWEAATLREVLTFEGQVVTFSPDGRHLATAYEDTVSIREVATGKELRTFQGHAAGVRGLAYSRDGKRLASCGDDHTVRVWEVDTGRTLDIFKGHTGPVQGLALSPDARLLASAALDHTVRLWQAGTGVESREVARPAEEGIARLALSRDGERLATSGAAGRVEVWDTARGANLLTIHPFRALLTGLAFSADGQRLAVGGVGGLLSVRDAATGRELGAPPAADHMTFSALAYSPDGRVLAAAQGQRVRLWDADAMTVLRDAAATYEAEVTSIAFRPDGRRIAVAGKGQLVTQVEVATGRTLGDLRHLHEARVLGGVACSPDGRRLASACEDGTVQTWEAETLYETDRRLVLFKGHSGPVNCLAYSPDGRRLATGGDDRTVRVWGAATGKELLTLRLPGPVRGLTFSPLGDALFAHDGEAVRVWETWPLREATGPNRWLRLALAHGSAGEWGKAREQLDRAAALAPVDPAVALARSWVETRAGRAAEARALREKVVQVTRLPPLDAAIGWGKGQTLPAPLAPERRRAAQEALGVLEQAERSAPHRDSAATADFWKACGWAHCAVRDWPAAVADFDLALFHDPKDWATRQARARVRLEEGKWTEAEADCTACLEAHPDNWECWYLRALARFYLERKDETVADLTEALEHGGDGPAVRFWRASLCRVLRQWDRVVADTTEVLKKRPTDKEMLSDRAVAHEGLRNIDAAAADWTAVAALAPNDYFARMGLNRVHLWRKEWDQAAEGFAKTIQSVPSLHVDVEAAYVQVGVAERTSEFYAQLLRLLPDDMQVRRASGLFAVRFSRWKEAAADYTTVTERQTNADADTWFEHACLRLLVNDREGHRKAVALMLKRGEEKKDLRPFLVARACTLAPLPAEDVKRAAQLADAELAENSEAFWSLMQRGERWRFAQHSRSARCRCCARR